MYGLHTVDAPIANSLWRLHNEVERTEKHQWLQNNKPKGMDKFNEKQIYSPLKNLITPKGMPWNGQSFCDMDRLDRLSVPTAPERRQQAQRSRGHLRKATRRNESQDLEERSRQVRVPGNWEE